MRRQLAFKFNRELNEKWFNTLSEAQKEGIRLALKDMMVAYFEMKRQPIRLGEDKSNFLEK